jgi:hypothetical protein
MSQNDDIEKASRDFAEEASDSTEYASGSAEETETLQVAEDLERSQEASGHDFSRVAEGSEEVGALAPEGSLPPLSMGALSMGAPGPSLLGTGESPASNSASEPSIITYEYEPPARIPHLGHLALFVAFLLFGFLCATVLMLGAYFLHLGGVTTQEQIKTNVVYLLGFEAILYIFTIALSIPLFPLLWRKSFFAGVQWRGRTALHWSWLLALIALGCFGLAMLDEVLLPGPEHAPIEELFRSPGAAWTMFIFGVTLAPFFEEMLFRGFLLPTLATAWDWSAERLTHQQPRPLDENGHPQWSLAAMIAAAIPTSLLFALIHADQQGHSLGPFLLLVTVSLILCAVRLKLRSLAASTLVHSCYNFLIFSMMLIGTDGFRHLDKM